MQEQTELEGQPSSLQQALSAIQSCLREGESLEITKDTTSLTGANPGHGSLLFENSEINVAAKYLEASPCDRVAIQKELVQSRRVKELQQMIAKAQIELRELVPFEPIIRKRTGIRILEPARKYKNDDPKLVELPPPSSGDGYDVGELLAMVREGIKASSEGFGQVDVVDREGKSFLQFTPLLPQVWTSEMIAELHACWDSLADGQRLDSKEVEDLAADIESLV